MSPEQARGHAVDRRADIWAFGCVLYEMLSGRQAFPGDTVSDTLSAVVERQPDWEALPSNTSERVFELLRRCLEKDPKERLRDIADARIHLTPAPDAQSGPNTGGTAGAGAEDARCRWLLRQQSAASSSVLVRGC